MKIGKLLMSAGWLLLGLGIVGISVWQSQGVVVWGSEMQPGYENLTMEHEQLDSEVKDLIEDLPKSEALPGDWNYLAKIAQDWAWWRLAGTEEEKTRRWLYLADERLRMGWDLCHEGNVLEAVETYGKAELYLQKALDAGVDLDEVDQAADRHYMILKSVEKYVPEEVRPKVTEALNISRSEGERASK